LYKDVTVIIIILMTISSLLFYCLFFSICFAGIVFELYSWYFAKQSKNWPSTQGTIINAYIDTQVSDDSSDTYSPKVSYSYRVDGVLFESKRLFFGSMHSTDYSEASDSLFNIHKNSKVNVYYDPNKPKRSVLHTGSGQVNLYSILIWLCLIAILFKIISQN